MSQIDKVTYLPILFWFLCYVIFIYLWFYFHIFRNIYRLSRFKQGYLDILFKEVINIFFLFRIFGLLFINYIIYTYFKYFCICWKSIKIVLSKFTFFFTTKWARLKKKWK